MKFSLEYPMDRGYDPRLLDPPTMARYAQTVERAGFSSIAFTEHPAPSQKWLDTGGHESLDPLTALAFLAGVTEHIRLMPHLLVLPYRNPLLAAKQATTVDIVSGGRLTLAVGSGYLRSEFLALGADFDNRNALFDEAIDVMRKIWTTNNLVYEGTNFRAIGQTQVPGPVQPGGPPFWFGGSSKKARQRVAALGQGWTPNMADKQLAATTRSPAIESPGELRPLIAEVRELAEAAGRDPAAIDVQVGWSRTSDIDVGSEIALDLIGQLAEAGATWIVIHPPREDAEASMDALLKYGEQVIARSA